MTLVSYNIKNANEKLGRFIDRAVAQIRPEDNDSFFGLREEFDQLVADKTVWSSVLNSALAAMVADPHYEGGGHWLMRRLLLHHSPQFSLSLATHFFELAGPQQRLEENKDYLLAPGGHVMMAFLHDQPVDIRRYTLPAGGNFDVFDPLIAMDFVGTTSFAPFERIEIDGHRDAIDFEMPEHAVAVVMNSSPCVSQLWSIEAQTLKPVGASIADESVSIMMTMINELGRSRHLPAIEVVEQLTHHSNHNIRWCAMKCLGRLSGTVAAQRLQHLALDPHPYVSSAARSTLARLETV